MNNLKIWPHLTIVALVCAVVAGIAVAVWLKHEQRVSAEALPNAARIQRVDGEVALSNGLDPSASDDPASNQWIAATPNQPFSVGDRIYTRDNSRTSLAFTGRNFARLNPNTSLDVISLGERRTQLALRDGSAMFDLGYLAPDELFEVATPYGAVDFAQPGLYNIGLDNGSAVVSVLSGLAQVVGLGGSGQISKGEVLTLIGQTAANVILSRLDGRNAGYLVDDYYGYQYPQTYDGRYLDYNAYLNDPYYFDPYQRNVSYQYVPGIVPGIYDLDYYGDWQNINGYGYSWRPRVDSGWAPYQQGYWISDYPYGMTWVSSEPWGYAPYHYGRWANVGNQWYWVPDRINTTPVYSPALVAFVPLNDANQIGWVPLAPGDPYVPRYYDANWQPVYLADTVQPTVTNLNIPGAVMVVPVDQFGRVIDPRSVRRADPHTLAQVRPVLDPLTLTPLRNAVLHSAWGRGKIDLPPGIAKKLVETRVVASAAPVTPRFRKDLARALRVEAAPEKAKHEKLKFKDDRGSAQIKSSDQQIESARPQRGEIGRDAARENKDARLRSRQVEQQQKQQQREQKKAERAASQSAQGERVSNRARGGAKAVREIRPEPRPQRNFERRAVPQTPQPQSVERPRHMQQIQRSPHVERPRAMQQVEQPQSQRKVERQAAAAQGQQHQQQVKAERKQGPPEGKSNPNQGGKGKGRKP